MRDQSKQPQPTPTSSWQENPRAMDDLPEYQRHWHLIRTRFHCRNCLLDWYNNCLLTLQPQEIVQHLHEIFTNQPTVLKVHVSFGLYCITSTLANCSTSMLLVTTITSLTPHSRLLLRTILNQSVKLSGILMC